MPTNLPTESVVVAVRMKRATVDAVRCDAQAKGQALAVWLDRAAKAALPAKKRAELAELEAATPKPMLGRPWPSRLAAAENAKMKPTPQKKPAARRRGRQHQQDAAD